MAKKQTRKSMSISGALYRELQAVCDARDQSVASAVSELIRAHLDALDRTTSAPSTAERLDALEQRVSNLEPADYRPDFRSQPGLEESF